LGHYSVSEGALGYVIGGGELKIDPSKMEAIMKWPVPANVYEVRSFIGAT